jgi:PPOX class probable F420-dependent enzyme
MKGDRQAFLAEPNVAVLSTVDGENRPHATPVWYIMEGDHFIVSVGRGSQKHVNAARNPNVSLTMDDRGLPYFAVMVQGTAAIGPPLTPDQRLGLAVRYLGEERGRRYVERTSGEDSVTLRITPRKVREYNGRTGRIDR